MFYYLRGNAKAVDTSLAVIDVGGVGYLVNITSYTMGDVMNSQGNELTLYTYLAVREDCVELYGFSQIVELDMFKLLITVSGIGPKAALSILSTLTPGEVSAAIASDNKKAISSAQGIGPKTAARVILELKDKVTKIVPPDESFDEQPQPLSSSHQALQDLSDALYALGYSKSEVSSVIPKIDKNGSVESMIKQALKYLMR